MFRKGYKVVTQSALGGKDQKRVASAISSAHPALSRSALDDVFPSKEVLQSVRENTGSGARARAFILAQEVSISKLAGSHTTIYSASGVPLFFDLDGRGILLPTVYASLIAPRNRSDCWGSRYWEVLCGL
jgi:hypothetical protein